ncbi:hypothetical protein AB1Y20_020860 [Prymnesium parvum]|uniref:GDPGP1-like N-terminal domain-containing protein n=1 Tax=Prymnesium parvum TaxID=97485 RepID=A0AB34JWF5_PRYPA|mmetsp:Transcript_48438/g.120034  ORF Transcript_48438/g.120034 Transcript_48438/m.120034 type:complete len:397 (+) Transcript_48438:179-1369(+)
MSPNYKNAFTFTKRPIMEVTEEDGQLSRAGTLDAELNQLDALPVASGVKEVHNWSLRPTSSNDFFLRESFNMLLRSSADLPADQRLIMYDACDIHEIRQQLGYFRKRIDARRNTKPKKPDAQLYVCTPFDFDAFNFTKIKNDRERILTVQLQTGPYDVLTNKFPLFQKHMLLVSKLLVPQQMTFNHLAAVVQLLQACSFCAYFNSWCASASVNHFHCHIIDEVPPVADFPLVQGPLILGTRCLQPQGFPGFCYVFKATQLSLVDTVIQAMQADNQPHNLMFTQRHIYIFPKPLQRPARSRELYPETVGGPELIGSFTVYNEEDYEAISAATIDELVRINTAPLPSRVLRRGGGGNGVDDAAVHAAVSRTTQSAIRASHSLDYFKFSFSGDIAPAVC